MGTAGKTAMRAVVRHPDIEPIGVRIYSQTNEGMDTGEICGLPATDVKVTRDLAEISAPKPECLIDAPGGPDYA